MMDILLITLTTGVICCVALIASQSGWLVSKTICCMLGVTFACLLAFIVDAPTPLIAVGAVLFTALLVWLGTVEHTDQNADQDAATDHQKEPYMGLLHPTVTEALRQHGLSQIDN